MSLNQMQIQLQTSKNYMKISLSNRTLCNLILVAIFEHSVNHNNKNNNIEDNNDEDHNNNNNDDYDANIVFETLAVYGPILTQCFSLLFP